MNEWRKVKLGEVINILNGYSFKKEDFSEYGIPVIKIKNIKSLIVDTEDVQFVNENFYEAKKKYRVNYKDILLSMTGSHISQINSVVGRVARMKKIGKYLLNQRVAKLVSKDKKILNEDFLYYFLSQEEITYQLALSAGGSANQANIGNNNIYELIINLPSIFLQEKIAKILSDIDEKIELNNKINNNLEILIFLIYQKIFLNNNFSQRKLCKMEEYFNISIGKTPPRKNKECFSNNSNDNIWVSILDMKSSGIYIDKSSEYLTSEAIKKYNVKVIPKNTLLLSFKLTIGRIAITCQDRTTTNEAIAHFLSDKKGATEYLYCYLKNFNFNTLGSTSSIATAINSKIIKEITFVIPEEDELNEFYNLVNPLFKKIRAFQLENIKLTNLKNYLLPKLMNGEIDIEKIEL